MLFRYNIQFGHLEKICLSLSIYIILLLYVIIFAMKYGIDILYLTFASMMEQ